MSARSIIWSGATLGALLFAIYPGTILMILGFILMCYILQ